MDNSSHFYPWQATYWGVIIYLRDAKLAAIQAPKIHEQKLPKELTKEALYMIYVILAHVLLAVLGSSITAYEYFCKGNGKKTHTQRNKFAWVEDCKRFLKCFCLVKNACKIIRIESAEKQNNTIYGLRSFFCLQIIALHVFQFYILHLKDVEKGRAFLDWRISLFFKNTVNADFFFVLSGFLNGYAFFQKYNKSNRKIFWIFFYFQRYIRLTYAYMIVLGIYTTLFTYTGTGSVWPDYNTNPVCKNGWWWNLLHINNFQDAQKECMTPYWYLAVDMQCYFISPLFMILLKRWPRLGRTIIFASIGGSCVVSFMLTYQYNLPDGYGKLFLHLYDQKGCIFGFFKYFDLLHKNSFMKINHYLIGVMGGLYLNEKTSDRNVIRNSKLTLYCGWVASAISLWISVFSFHNREEILLETALFNGIKHLLASCSFVWIIYVGFTKQSELLEACFSWKVFAPINRLTYCAYITHAIILMNLFLQTEDLMDFSFTSWALLYLYVVACTFITSFIVSMLFEMPANNFVNWLVKKKGKMSDGKADTENLSDLKKIS